MLKIAVATLHTPNIESYALETLANKVNYCGRHSYALLSQTTRLSGRAPSWDKVCLLQRWLANFDWILWMDADSIVTNPTIPIEPLLQHERKIVMASDSNGVNAGVFLIRNCEWSRVFLDEVWRQDDLINHLWWDNAAIHRLYRTHSDHFQVVAQRTINAYEDVWEPGDFILHFPGKSTDYRRARLPVYCELAKGSPDSWLVTMKNRNEFPRKLVELGLLGEGVELGVAEGDYSEFLLNAWPGKKLHLVDPWRRLDSYRDITNAANNVQQRRFEQVTKRMAKFANRFEIHRCLSAEAVRKFEDRSLDFVYIDANHAESFVYQDLCLWYEKLRDGGILAGHDYLDGALPEGDFGVKTAVTRFAAERKLRVWTTLETCWPSFFLLKGDQRGAAPA